MTLDDHNHHFDPTIVFNAPQNAVSDFLTPVVLILEDTPHFSLLTKASIKTSRRTSPIKPSPCISVSPLSNQSGSHHVSLSYRLLFQIRNHFFVPPSFTKESFIPSSPVADFFHPNKRFSHTLHPRFFHSLFSIQFLFILLRFPSRSLTFLIASSLWSSWTSFGSLFMSSPTSSSGSLCPLAVPSSVIINCCFPFGFLLFVHLFIIMTYNIQ